MKSLTGSWIALFAGMLILSFFVSCTPENSLVKTRDYRNTASGDKIEDSEYNEESNDFSAADKGKSGKWSDKSAKGDEESGDRDGGDSSYKKDAYYQTGLASWYGREFNGRKTASGERFDMNGLTAAHKTLPFGTVVKIKNFDNGKTITVRINDRGPYKGKRIIDLSYGAAKKLGMLGDGQTQVGIKIMKKGGSRESVEDEEDGNTQAVSGDTDEGSGSDGAYAIQAGAFYSRRNAENLKETIEGMTKKSVVIVRDGDMFKVRIEGLTSKKDVTRLKRTLSDKDIPSYMINKNE
jgi:rare lipoprotein A